MLNVMREDGHTRAFALLNMAAIASAIFVPLNWIIFLIVNLIAPFIFWIVVAAQIGSDFDSKIYCFQFSVCSFNGILAYFLQRSKLE